MKTRFIICFTALSIAASAQGKPKVTVNIPEKGIAFTGDNIQLSNDGCELSGNVTQTPIEKNLPVDAHNVPGIITNINQIGGTWVIQCTAGPGYCFTWYSK